MKFPALVQSAIDVSHLFLKEDKPLDHILYTYLKNKRYIGSHDRQELSNLIFDVFRHLYRLDHLASQTNIPHFLESPRWWFLCYLTLVRPQKDMNAVFSGKQYEPPALTYSEKSILNDLMEHSLSPSSIEIPSFMLDYFSSSLKDEKELEALTTSAPLDLRVNERLGNRKEVLKTLKSEGYEASLTPHSPWGIRILSKKIPPQHALLQDGTIEIQDEGSQIISFLTQVKPSMSVLDFCAGAGGKTLALSMMMENKGRLFACDVSAWRLKRAKERFQKAGAFNIQSILLDAQGMKWIKRHENFFDCVLVDSPCTGTGTWRRNPDLKLRTTEQTITELVEKQGAILKQAAHTVKPGGTLVYATCSLLSCENEKQIEAFLLDFPEFQLVDINSLLPKGLISSSPMLQLTPYQHGTDGFFCAVLEKKKD